MELRRVVDGVFDGSVARRLSQTIATGRHAMPHDLQGGASESQEKRCEYFCRKYQLRGI
jgi:hypothetical protein